MVSYRGCLTSPRQTGKKLHPGPLDGLRAAVGHSASAPLALDDLEGPQIPTLDQLRARQRRLRAQLGAVPPDPSRDIRRLTEDCGRERSNSREDAERRLRIAERDPHKLVPIGRRTHRAERQEIEQHITSFEVEIDRAESERGPSTIRTPSWRRRSSNEPPGFAPTAPT
jgi:hypothetical protein